MAQAKVLSSYAQQSYTLCRTDTVALLFLVTDTSLRTTTVCALLLLQVELYERSFDEAEMLGLNDIKTEGYEQVPGK